MRAWILIMMRKKGKCTQNVAVSTHTVVTQLNLTEVIVTHTVHTVVLLFVPFLKKKVIMLFLIVILVGRTSSVLL
jgi:hypothetical protein